MTDPSFRAQILTFTYPLIALAVVLVLTLLAIWLIPRLWRTLRRIARRVAGWFGARHDPAPPGRS